MEILLISDLHSQKHTLFYLEQIIKKHNIKNLVCPGDITQNNDIGFFNDFVAIIKRNGVKAGLIWGNNDHEQIRQKISACEYNLNLKKINFGKLIFFGIGDGEEGARITNVDFKKICLVTHRPPKFEVLRKPLINAPRIHVSGHIHSAAREVKFKSTTLIQVPSLMFGKYAIFNSDNFKTAYFESRSVVK